MITLACQKKKSAWFPTFLKQNLLTHWTNMLSPLLWIQNIKILILCNSYLFIHAFWNIMFKFKTVLKTLYFVGPKPSLNAPYSFKTFFKVHVLAACWKTNITNIDQLEGVRLNGCILFTPRYNGQCWMIVFNNLGGVHPFYFMVLKSQINATCPNLFNEILV